MSCDDEYEFVTLPGNNDDAISARKDTEGEARAASIARAVRGLKHLTIGALKAELQLNNQVVAKRRAEMLHQVAEGRILGALPPCLCCGNKMRWDPRKCHFFCVAQFTTDKCSFSTAYVERLPWRVNSKKSNSSVVRRHDPSPDS